MSEPSLGRERIKWQDIFVVGLNIIRVEKEVRSIGKPRLKISDDL